MLRWYKLVQKSFSWGVKIDLVLQIWYIMLCRRLTLLLNLLYFIIR